MAFSKFYRLFEGQPFSTICRVYLYTALNQAKHSGIASFCGCYSLSHSCPAMNDPISSTLKDSVQIRNMQQSGNDFSPGTFPSGGSFTYTGSSISIPVPSSTPLKNDNSSGGAFVFT